MPLNIETVVPRKRELSSSFYLSIRPYNQPTNIHATNLENQLNWKMEILFKYFVKSKSFKKPVASECKQHINL